MPLGWLGPMGLRSGSCRAVLAFDPGFMGQRLSSVLPVVVVRIVANLLVHLLLLFKIMGCGDGRISRVLRRG